MLAGEDFIFEVPCTSTSALCDQRRFADGGKNHSHPVVIEPPTKAETSTHKDAVDLRLQCQALGIDVHMGVQTDIEKRCETYRQRIRDYLAALERAKEAKVFVFVFNMLL